MELSKNDQLAQNIIAGRKGINEDIVYEIVMPIESSLFSSNQNLPTNTPIDISFERLPARYSTVSEKSVLASTLPTYLTLEEPYLVVPFKHDLNMEEMERNAISRPIKVCNN